MSEVTRKLGRLRSIDARDHLFLVPRPKTLPSVVRKTWTAAGIWDQGQTSMCVSYATNMYLASSPIRNKIPPTKLMDFNGPLSTWLSHFYKLAQERDEWPGESYDGTSVRGAMKALTDLGFISGYNWAFDVNSIVAQILTTGPVVVGTDWTDSMFTPTGKDEQIVVSPNGKYEPIGGHSYLLIGVDRGHRNLDKTKGAFRILNSWGKSWGENGRAWISFSDMGLLLNNGGEAAIAMEVLK